MLNVYEYYEPGNELDRYTDLNHLIARLNNPAGWEPHDKFRLEPLLDIIRRSPRLAFFYADKVLERRWPEVEHIIKKAPLYALNYTLYYLSKDKKWTSEPGHENGRWPEAEPNIMKIPEHAALYAWYILRRRWPEAEPYIKQSSKYWSDYRKQFNIQENE